MAVADFAAEWFETEVLRGRGLRARHLRDAGRTLVGGHHRATCCCRPPRTAATAPGRPRSSRAAWARSSRGARGRGARLRGRDPHRRRGRAHRHAGRARRRASCSRAARRSRRAAVVSGVDPHRTFLRLLDPALLDPDDLRRIRDYRQNGHGLEGATSPSTACRPSPPSAPRTRRALLRGPHPHRARAWTTWSAPSTTPSTAASRSVRTSTSRSPRSPTRRSRRAGQHVMSVVRAVHALPPARGRAGATRRDEVADAVLRLLEEYAPGIGAAGPAPPGGDAAGPRAALRPHRRPSVARRAVARPALRHAAAAGLGAATAARCAGLYLCGAGTHPGGGVTGAPGPNAAREILKDLG